MRRRGVLTIALSAALIAVEFSHASLAEPSDQGPSVLVQLAKLQRGSLPQTITAYGTVQADPSARQTVMAPLSAVVGQIYIRTGEEVASGAPLIRLGPTPQAAATYAQAQSALRAATELVDRTRTMLGQHLATAQQLADAIKAQADARTTLSELDAEGAGGAQILRAPFPAIVAAVATSPGAIVAQGGALLDLDRPDALVLELGVVPEQADKIQSGNTVNIVALGAKDPVPGKVVLRGRLIDPRTGLVPIDVALPPARFLAGQMVEAEVVTAEAQGYVVPHEAILVNEGGNPYVVQAIDMIAKKVSIRVLAAAGARDVVDGPLDPKWPVVLAGNYQLSDGMRVRVAGPDGASAK